MLVVCVSALLRGGSWEPGVGRGGPERRRIESIMGGRRSSALGMEEERTGEHLVSRRSGECGRRGSIGGEKNA
jgi:hypothetical protein